MDDKQQEFLKPFTAFLDTSNQETDRGRVLVAAAQIDGMLEEIIRAFLIPEKQSEALFKGANAPLSSLFNKANFAAALGLISEEESHAIDILRKVRNLFAHSVELSIEDEKVANQIRRLSFGIGQLISGQDSVIENPRSRFQMCVTSLIGALYNRAHYVQSKALTKTEWPL
ncbi:hypothetical protein [Celeribacter halophilus]|uniref:hypothetical protein n=1 Tax=Celeribacter halophilus TaxID=576117 RepID=UPI003A91774F